MIPEYYEFSCPVKIVSGLKALSQLPYEMDLAGCRRALLITDVGVVNAGLIKRVEAVFEGTETEIGAVYDKTPPDSSTAVVNEAAKLFQEASCDCFVAVGGGSCIDTAKGANIVVVEDSNDLLQFQGAERITKPLKPFIVIPTTAGTGSEVTLVAVIHDEERHVKIALTSYRLLPNVAILDPKMTLTMPPKITAATGMDALTHAIEAYYGLQKNPVSDAFATTAIQLIRKHLITCVEHGDNEEARLAMANAALCAGIAFSNSMVGVVHALAHSCGAVSRVPHGVANAVLLPWGMESNLKKAGRHIAALAPLLGVTASYSTTEKAKAAIKAVRDLGARLNELCNLPTTLQEAGVTEEQLEAIAKAAINDGAVTYNPEAVTFEDALQLLKKAYT